MSYFYTVTQAKADYQKALDVLAAKDQEEVNRILTEVKRSVDAGNARYSIDLALNENVTRMLRDAGFTVTYQAQWRDPETIISGWANGS